REHLAHEDRIDGVGGDGPPLQRALDRGAAQLHGGERGELTLQPSLRSAGGGDDDDVVGVHATSFRSSEMMSSGSVAATTSATVTPGASSVSTRPSSVTSMTARSVMMRSTTPLPVSGSEHWFTIFA